jgi:CRP/FNR family transcriptional regulator, cyclic AMP receptor protein
MTQTEAKLLIQRHGWLASQPAWLRDSVLSRAKLRTYEPHEFTFHAEDDPGGIYGVISGGFGVMLPSGGGEMVLCHILRLGVWFGTGPVMTGGPRMMSFKALEPSSALHLSLSSIAEIKSEHVGFAQRLGSLSEANYSRIAAQVIVDLMMPSTERRIAATLARISRPEASSEVLAPWPIHLTQAELGQMANASRDRVSHALSKFEALGWIEVDYRIIRIKDLAALTTHAEKSGS